MSRDHKSGEDVASLLHTCTCFYFLAASESLKPQAAAETTILHADASVLFPSKNCDKTSFKLIGIGRRAARGGIDQSLEMS